MREKTAHIGAGYTGRRWYILVLLFLVTFINYFDRQTLGCAIEPISTEFGLDMGQRGRLLSAFVLTYALSHLFIGFLTDNVRRIKLFFGTLVTGWSLCTVLVGFVNDYWQLLFLRYALGFFEAVNFPICLMLIARLFPANERTLASGIFSSGGFLATLAAPKFTIFFSTNYNWRYAFIISGMLGILWLFFWLCAYRETENHNIQNSLSFRAWVESISKVFRTPGFWGVTCLGLGLVPCLYFCTQWLPSYFVHELNQPYDMALANKLTVVYLFQDLGMWVSGGLVMMLVKRHMPILNSRKLVIVLGFVLMMSCVFLFFIKQAWLNVMIFAVFIFGLGLCLANQHSFKQDVLPGQVATVSALVGFCETLFTSFILSRVGVAVQVNGNYSVTIWILISCAIFSLVAAIFLLKKKWFNIN